MVHDQELEIQCHRFGWAHNHWCNFSMSNDCRGIWDRRPCLEKETPLLLSLDKFWQKLQNNSSNWIRYFVKTHGGIIPSFDPSSAAAPLKTFNISDECWEKRVDEPMPYDETRFYGSLEKPGDEDLNEVSRQISRQMITIARGAGKSSELDCFLRQNLQKTAEVFLTHNQICLKLACWAGWVAPLALCLSINVPSANTGYLDVSLTSFLICLPWFLFSTVIFKQAQSTEQTAYLLHWTLIECCKSSDTFEYHENINSNFLPTFVVKRKINM